MVFVPFGSWESVAIACIMTLPCLVSVVFDNLNGGYFQIVLNIDVESCKSSEVKLFFV